jgi:hypothetical protein
MYPYQGEPTGGGEKFRLFSNTLMSVAINMVVTHVVLKIHEHQVETG